MLTGHTDAIACLELLKNHCLASGSRDTTVILWNVTTGAIIKTLFGHLATVQTLLFFEKFYLASGSYDTVILPIFWRSRTEPYPYRTEP